MGTNFYAIEKISRNKRAKLIDLASDMATDFKTNEDIQRLWEEYQELINDELPKPFHLGKRSAGWQFLWDYPALYNNIFNTDYTKLEGEYPITLDTIKELLKNKIIYDEYNRSFTLDEFLNDEIGYCLYKTDELDDGMDGEYSSQYFINDGLRFSRFTDFS